jgi:hypothetical protein
MVIGLSVSSQNPRRVSYISLPGGKYMRNGDSNYHFTLSSPKMAQALLSLALFAAGLFAAAAEVYAQTPSARLAVTVSPNTLTVGSEANIKISRLDASGKPAAPVSEITVTLTLTTLETLKVAKRMLSERKSRPSQLTSQQTATLPPDKDSIQYTCNYPSGLKEIQLKVKSERVGRLNIFAESRGMFPGSTLLLMLKSSRPAPARTTRPRGSTTSFHYIAVSGGLIPATHLIPAIWAPSPPLTTGDEKQYQLYFTTTGGCAYVQDKEWVSEYFLTLGKTGSKDTDYVAAPREIQIDLEVTGGVTLASKRVTIKSSESRSEKIYLKSRSASNTKGDLIATVIQGGEGLIQRSERFKYDITPCTYATYLLLEPSAWDALPNGVDGVTITVSAQRHEEDGDKYVLTGDELLEEREVYFDHTGGVGFRFVDEKKQETNRIVIPKNKYSGQITLLGILPVKDLSISAHSENCLRDRIRSESKNEPKYSFKWPWGSLTLTMLGGLLCSLLLALPGRLAQTGTTGVAFLPLLRRSWLKLLWGSVIGLLLFCLLFYGAITSGSVPLFGLKVDLAKLPIRSSMASLILGFVGSLVFDGVATRALRLLRARSSKPKAKPPSVEQ